MKLDKHSRFFIERYFAIFGKGLFFSVSLEDRYNSISEATTCGSAEGHGRARLRAKVTKIVEPQLIIIIIIDYFDNYFHD